MPALPKNIDERRLVQLIRLAGEEDLGTRGDITSSLLPAASKSMHVAVVARQAGVLAGGGILSVLLDVLCGVGRIKQEELLSDGTQLQTGTQVCYLQGPADTLLAAERTVLNFLQRLCGVATLTRRYVDRVKEFNTKIYDTRKTLPGWRDLDKYAVRCGGGSNHRHGLHDAVLIKDNHLADIPGPALATTVAEMVHAAGRLSPAPNFFEVEVDTLKQLGTILRIDGIDVILLDNFSLEDMARAVELRRAAGREKRVQLEASGGITLTTVCDIARTGVDRLAVGAITHAAAALDLGFDRLE